MSDRLSGEGGGTGAAPRPRSADDFEREPVIASERHEAEDSKEQRQPNSRKRDFTQRGHKFGIAKMRQGPVQKHDGKGEQNHADNRRQHTTKPSEAWLSPTFRIATCPLLCRHAPSARRMLARIRLASAW